MLSAVTFAAGKAPGAHQGQGQPGRRGAGVGSWQGWGGSQLCSLGVAIAAGNAHFMRSWVPMDGHPVRGLEERGPQVRELGLHGAGNHVFHSRSYPTWRSQKRLAFAVKAFTRGYQESSEPRSFPKKRSVRWKSKEQNSELWPAGPALLLELCRPAGP